MRDIHETIAQLRYWAERDENFAGMFISRACPDGSMLDNPALHPLFAASQELDLPIWVHGGANRPPLTPWVHASNAVYHGVGGMYAIERAHWRRACSTSSPRSASACSRAACGWMPWIVEKLDDGFRPGSSMTPNLKRKPSEIVAEGRLFCAVEADEELSRARCRAPRRGHLALLHGLSAPGHALAGRRVDDHRTGGPLREREGQDAERKRQALPASPGDVRKAFTDRRQILQEPLAVLRVRD